MDIWYQLVKTILRTYTAAFIKGIEIEGAENLVPGPKIIAANHANATDCFTLPLIMKEKLHFLVQAESFTVPILGNLLSRADQIPVVRRQGYDALKIAEDRLARGNSIVIFPEGKLNHGRDFHRPRIGAVLLSMLSNIPIIPVGFYVSPDDTRTFHGRFHSRKAVARWQCSGKCFVHIGQPYRLDISPGNESDYHLLRKLTSQLMEKINYLVQKANESAQLSINLQLPDLNLEAR